MDDLEKEARIRDLEKMEIRIVYFLCAGWDYEDLALREDLGFGRNSEKSIEGYLTKIYSKLGIGGRRGKELRLKTEYKDVVERMVPDLETIERWIPVPRTQPIPAPEIFTGRKNFVERVLGVAGNRTYQWIAGLVVMLFVGIFIGSLFNRPTVVVAPTPSSTSSTSSTSLPPSSTVAVVLDTSVPQPTTGPVIPTEPIQPTDTPQPTETKAPTFTRTITLTPTDTLTPTPSNTPTETPTYTPTPVVLFEHSFSDGYPDDWNIVEGTLPIITDGVLLPTNDFWFSIGDESWTNYQIYIKYTGLYDCNFRYSVIAVRAKSKDESIWFTICWKIGAEIHSDGNKINIPNSGLTNAEDTFLLEVSGTQYKYRGKTLTIPGWESGKIYFFIPPGSGVVEIKIMQLP